MLREREYGEREERKRESERGRERERNREAERESERERERERVSACLGPFHAAPWRNLFALLSHFLTFPVVGAY